VFSGTRTSPTPELIMFAVAGKLQQVLPREEAVSHARKRARVGRKGL
jgi:hypothetical protein